MLRRVLLLVFVVIIAACGKDSPTNPSPRTRFGAGQYRVGDDIAAGRYFTAVTDGCYWERQSGLSGTLLDVVANDFVDYSAPQYILDILGSDVGFETDARCGTWDQAPKGGTRATIPSGVWLVGSQVAPGTYRTTAPAGCYWERVRNFEHRLASIIAADFVFSGGGQQFVTIRADDTGFQSDDCGTWELVSSSSVSDSAIATSSADVEHHWEAWRARKNMGGRR
jgi:hypothetical protein